MAYQAIRDGITEGRDGKGTVFVFSAGNGAGMGDSSNYHNFQNAREVIAVGAVGADGRAASFSSPGANVLVGSYGINLITTDRVGGYGYNKAGDYTLFSGTSAAAPTVSGVVALMLEANPSLGYRDVQQILAYASTHPETQSWKQNAASNLNLGGLSYNDTVGFGVVDAYQAVRLARTWRQTDSASNEFADGARVLSTSGNASLNQVIPDDGIAVVTKTVVIDSSIQVEHLELGVDLKHSRLGDLTIEVTSPSGTTSLLMNRPTVSPDNPFAIKGNNFNFLAQSGASGTNFNFLNTESGIDGSNFNFLQSGADVDGANFNFLASSEGSDSSVASHLLWDFSSVQFWGEEAKGTWTITVRDVAPGESGVLNGLSLRVFGEATSDNDIYVFTDEGFKSQGLRKLADEQGQDLINAVSMSTDLLIDLGRQGQIASLGVVYQIESWSVIEDAIGGAANDRILGNESDNRIEGMEGQDTLLGGLGNDTLIGGAGLDTAVYMGRKEEYVLAWNATTRLLTVTDAKFTAGDKTGSDSNEGVDILEGIERIAFADGETMLGAMVGNLPPVANSALFNQPISVAKGVGIDFDLPATAFADPDGDSESLLVSVESGSGGELPTWLSFDPKLKKFTGVPPVDLQGQIKLKLKAYDDFGSEVADVLVLQFGSNQAPIVDASKQITLNEDASPTPFAIAQPIDPEGKSVTIRILEVPAKGSLIDGQNSIIQEGAVISALALNELYFVADPDQNGSAGQLRYEARDADNVTAESSVRVFISPVNDPPRFSNKPTTAMVSFPMSAAVALEIAQVTDPETVVSQVKVVELPALGSVRLQGQAIVIDQMLTLDEAQNLSFLLSENVNGPIGRLSLRATDAQDASTIWSLALEVQGLGGSNSGNSGPDALYGSIAADTLYGFGGDDTLAGNAGDDRLLGGTGNDSLFGGSGNDTMDGSSGNDYLDGGIGDDQMAGGPGHDTYLVDSARDLVIEAISGGAGGKDLVITRVSMVAPSNVETLQAEDGFLIDLTGNELDNSLVGNNSPNNLVGGLGRDTLMGAGGNDTLDGGAGVDRLIGGIGDDKYRVDSRVDMIIEFSNEGFDSVEANSSFTLPPNVENLILTGAGDLSGGGNARDNHIVGNSGNNILAGGAGTDTLEGGLGDDVYVLSDSLDLIIDTGGNDTVRSSLDLTLPLSIENGELVGIADATLQGNSLANRLVGNLGDNVIEGGLGADTLTGGAGSDQFIISKNASGESLDVITDFESGLDLLVIDLSSFGINVKALGLVSSGTVALSSFIKSAGAKPLDQDDFFILDTARGVLMFDPDGSGANAAIDLVKFVGTSFAGIASADIYVGI
jgi:Ca2+-binding RTX toxin-like protein/subtilisin-like proprotein convertase family protein